MSCSRSSLPGSGGNLFSDGQMNEQAKQNKKQMDGINEGKCSFQAQLCRWLLSDFEQSVPVLGPDAGLERQ